MKALATALIDVMAFLELSDDDVVEPDSAVKVLESVGATLEECTVEERAALQEALAQARRAEENRLSRPEVLEFYDTFMEIWFPDESEDMQTVDEE